MRELVSVIIPCHNHAHYLGEAIDSVLKQTYPNIEMLVIDDGSTDDIARVIAAYPSVRFIRQGNHGVSRARNVGLHNSEGTFILFLDADDRLLPDAITIGVRALSSHQDCAFTFGSYVWTGTPKGTKELAPDYACTYTNLLTRNFIGNPGSVLYNRWVFSRIGDFDESNAPAADYDLYLRVAQRFPILYHRQPVVEYRWHGENMSNNSMVMFQATMNALMKQKRFVRSDAEMKAAFETGVQYFRGFYGEPLIDSIHANIAQLNFKKATRELFVLIRFFPARLWSFGNRRIASLYSALRHRFSPRRQPLL